MSRNRIALTILAVAATAGTALADGRVWAQDASGAYNGTDASGGAFIMNRIGTPGANGFNAAQNNAGYVGARLGQMGLAPGAFYTFCIERGENVSLGNNNGSGNRYYAQISDSARNGGNGTNNAQAAGPRNNGAGEDVISFATAKIYQEFRNGGNFGGVGSVAGGGSSFVSAIQWAIWYAENEMTAINNTQQWINQNNTVGQLAYDIFTWANNAANHKNTLGNVRVLRLWTSFDASTGTYSGNSQDQLTLIPLPSASALAGVGLLVLAARRRKNA